jgi:type II secretory pathway pseudopilin PulG
MMILMTIFALIGVIGMIMAGFAAGAIYQVQASAKAKQAMIREASNAVSSAWAALQKAKKEKQRREQRAKKMANDYRRGDSSTDGVGVAADNGQKRGSDRPTASKRQAGGRGGSKKSADAGNGPQGRQSIRSKAQSESGDGNAGTSVKAT